MEFFDSHAHYNDERFKEDMEQVVQDIYESGITSFVCAGYDLAGSKQAVKIAEAHPFIYATVGISPNDVNEEWEKEIEQIEDILKTKNSKVVAVGEIGLDYHYDIDKEMQKQAFIEQIKLANKYNLPIVIHTREATVDTVEMLKQYPVNKKGVFHCCPFNKELIKEALKLGFYISVAGPITFKNSKNAEEIANLIPLDKMLIETDSPYLAPEPVRGTRNDSRNLKIIAKKIADFRKIAIEEIAENTYKNAKKIFNIK